MSEAQAETALTDDEELERALAEPLPDPAPEPDDDEGDDDDAADAPPAPPPPPPKKKRDRVGSPRAQALKDRAARRASAETAQQQPPREPARSLDDVVARHAPPADEPPDSDPAWTSDSDVPPLENDPRMRRKPTVLDPIEAADGVDFPDTAGRGPPRNLTDASSLYFSAFPSGQVFIRVERIKPEISKGVRTAGYLGRIWHPMTEDEFEGRFGGGVYQLQVYGPDPRGKRDTFTGQPIIKALTKPFHQSFWGDPLIAPDLDEARSPAMHEFWSPTQGRGGGPQRPPRPPPPPTSAEAQMHGQALTFAERALRDERNENREHRNKVTSQQTDPASVLNPVLGVVRDTATATVDAMREQATHTKDHYERELERRDREMAEIRRELSAARDRPSDTTNAFSRMGEIAKAIAPGKQSDGELQRLHDLHRDDLRRAEEAHRTSLDAQARSYEQRIGTLNEQLEHERRRARDEQTDLRRQYDERERGLREEIDRRVNDERERHRAEQARLREERQNEIDRQKGQFELIRATDATSHKGELSAMKERIETLRDELARAREEAADKDDFETQITKIERGAKALGFQRQEDSNPKDWKEYLARSIGHAFQNADKIIKSAADTFRARAEANEERTERAERRGLPSREERRQEQAPRRAVRQPMPRREVWASDDNVPIAGQERAPATPSGSPPFQPAAAAPPRPVAPSPEPAPHPQPQPQQQAAPPPPPPNGSGAGVTIDPEQLELFRMWAEGEIEAGRDPATFAASFVERVGIEGAIQTTSMGNAEQIGEALAQSAATAGSPIVRRDGQQWLQKAWTAMRRIIREHAEADRAS